MISISKLLTDAANFGDSLRYSSRPGSRPVHGSSTDFGPVVVLNLTKACNLKCIHCYANAQLKPCENELSTQEVEGLINDLSQFRVPVLLFSGGEPLLRKDIFHLIRYTSNLGIRPVVSTNGTLITREFALSLKESGVKYVGISLDGIGQNNDRFRGLNGAFDKALSGIRNCLNIGQKVGLRFTINKNNLKDLEDIFKLIEEEKIPRACFYHLVYKGRGSKLVESDLSHEESRMALDMIIKKTLDFRLRGINTEILTVDNHADGIYLYLWAVDHDHDRAEKILELLKRNGGNRSGIAFANIDWLGNVHPDQFLHDINLGNIRERKFSEIWADPTNPVLAGLRNRKPLLKGRCSQCKWLEVCNGNFRARALSTGDFWASDPACYLTDKEIGIK
ncbi:MAG: radical SAM protein [Bacillota bacterium]